MVQEDKELLLKDLCARLPYGVKCNINGEDIDIGFVGITAEIFPRKSGIGFSLNEDIIKPYLRPMSSMTEEEIKELSEIDKKRLIFSSRHLTWHLDGEVIDYLNKKMFDWRGLIHLGIALEAPEGMYENRGI